MKTKLRLCGLWRAHTPVVFCMSFLCVLFLLGMFSQGSFLTRQKKGFRRCDSVRFVDRLDHLPTDEAKTRKKEM